MPIFSIRSLCYLFSLSLESYHGIRIVVDDCAKLFAGLHLFAASAGLYTSGEGALANRTERFTVGRLCTFDPAARTVDHLRRDLHAVQFRPLPGTIRRITSSWFTVAIRASQVSQSSPQYAIYAFTGIPPIILIVVRLSALCRRPQCWYTAQLSSRIRSPSRQSCPKISCVFTKSYF